MPDLVSFAAVIRVVTRHASGEERCVTPPVSKIFFGTFGPQFGLNIRGGGGGAVGPPLDPPLNRKAPGLRCKFATKLMTCSPVLLSPGTD